MKKIIVGGIVSLTLISGCMSTTATINVKKNIDGSMTLSIKQPKDVTMKNIEASAPDGAKLKIQDYTSSANVGAMQAQSEFLNKVLEVAKPTLGMLSIP